VWAFVFFVCLDCVIFIINILIPNMHHCRGRAHDLIYIYYIKFCLLMFAFICRSNKFC